MKIEKGRRVRIKVHLEVVGGETLEKSVVEYIQGGGKMLPGLEALLRGLEKGAKKNGVLPAKQAFGDPAMSPEKKIARAEFPKDANLKVGERFAAKGADGRTDVVLEIAKVTDQEVTCRLVHPLADKDLRFDVEILSVTDPAPPPMPAQALDLKDG